MSIKINAYQLRQAAEFAAPDYEREEEQRDTEVCLERMSAGTFHDGEPRPAGLYVWLSDYPEEGCMLLDEVPAALSLAEEGAGATNTKGTR